MSLHTPAEWAQSAVSNLYQAQSSQDRARYQNGRSKSAHATSINNNVVMYQELAQAMKHKVSNSYKLIEMMQKRADSIEKSIQQTTNSLRGLEKALRDKDAPLQLCQWRAEQREKRPLREQVRDAVETALEEEKAVILDTQNRLREAIQKTKVMIQDLNHGLQNCQRDIEHKMQALSVDETCLKTTEISMHRVLQQTPPPTGSGSRSPNGLKVRRHQAHLQESTSNEAARQRQAEQFVRALAAKEEQAHQLREENGKLARWCESRAAEARAKTERKLQERIQESQLVRRELETELKETQQRINETKHTMSETKYHLKALDEPVGNTATCSSFRKQRASKEGIVDPVSTNLLNHRATIHDTQKELSAHHMQERCNLQDLLQRKQQLKEDLADKTAALHIDLNCMAHESVQLNGQTWTGLSKSKAGWMNKVDRNWVPGTVSYSARTSSRHRVRA